MMEINHNYLPALSRIFSPLVLDVIAQKGKSPFLSEVCKNSGLIDKIDFATTLREFIDRVYNHLLKNYRNEYIYKNVITNNILLGTHSLNTTQILMEFRVGRCKADIVLLNGASTVYEIKTQYDSFTRLEKQIQAYFKVFEYINVITSPSQIPKLQSLLPEKAGILVLTNRNNISTIRKAKSNIENVIPHILFDSLRKSEYKKIVKEYYGTIPDVPNTQIYRECKKVFCKIPPVMAHNLTIQILKERNNTKGLKDFLNNAPSSVSAYAFSICNDRIKMQKLLNQFDNKIHSLI
ncbi:sce7726 family protein [candidate division KSB1 bacterium]